jgi:hypothetical protein
MFYNDHGPAHFHALYGEFQATIDIESLSVLEGRLPRRWSKLDSVMHWDVLEVRPKTGFSLWVRFADGTSGEIRLDPDNLTGVLAPLRDADFFDRAFVDHGAVVWPGEIDLAPDAMYKAIRDAKTGEVVTLSE